MKQMRIIMGTLFFVSLIVGAIPAQAKTDPITGMRVVKPYFFQTSTPTSVEFQAAVVLPPMDVPIVHPDNLKIRARLTFQPNVAYHLEIKVKDAITERTLQTLFVFFNDGNIGSGANAAKGKIGLSEDSLIIPKMILDVPNPGKADIKVLSSGLPPDNNLQIEVTLMPFNGSSPVKQIGFVRTSIR